MMVWRHRLRLSSYGDYLNSNVIEYASVSRLWRGFGRFVDKVMMSPHNQANWHFSCWKKPTRCHRCTLHRCYSVHGGKCRDIFLEALETLSECRWIISRDARKVISRRLGSSSSLYTKRLETYLMSKNIVHEGEGKSNFYCPSIEPSLNTCLMY